MHRDYSESLSTLKIEVCLPSSVHHPSIYKTLLKRERIKEIEVSQSSMSHT